MKAMQEKNRKRLEAELRGDFADTGASNAQESFRQYHPVHLTRNPLERTRMGLAGTILYEDEEGEFDRAAMAGATVGGDAGGTARSAAIMSARASARSARPSARSGIGSRAGSRAGSGAGSRGPASTARSGLGSVPASARSTGSRRSGAETGRSIMSSASAIEVARVKKLLAREADARQRAEAQVNKLSTELANLQETVAKLTHTVKS